MGIISPRAIKAFLHEPRDDYTWMKSLKEKELDVILKDLGFTVGKPDEPLDKHQKVCVVLGIMHPAFAFFLDMGTGKTRVTLELLRHWHLRGDLKTALVLAPSDPVLIGWENQIKYWKTGLPYTTLFSSSSASKWELINETEGGLILCTYPGLSWVVSQMEQVKYRNKPAKNKLRIYKPSLKKLAAKVNALVLDESTKVANHGSLFYRVAHQLRKTAPICYELAGRPFGRDPISLWSQLHIIDRGETLGDTLGMFRAALFTSKQGYWGNTEYKFDKAKEPILNRMLRHRSIEYSEAECGHKHKLISKLEEVIMPKETMVYYLKFLEQLKKQHAGVEERQNSFIRMRQASSGFIGYTKADSDDKAKIWFAQNPKLDRLLELLDEMPKDRKFVIWHEFTASGERICEELTKRKIKHLRGWSGTENSRAFQDAFDHDPRVRGAVINHKWGAYGLNLQAANYEFIYESPVSSVDRDQMDKRLPRRGQTRTVFRSDLVCRSTVDARILAFHREGADLFKALMRDPRKALGKQEVK